jgi:hypothetical protein
MRVRISSVVRAWDVAGPWKVPPEVRGEVSGQVLSREAEEIISVSYVAEACVTSREVLL